MRVLLISTNQENFPYPVIPLGAAVIAQGLKQNGHHVRLLDLMFVQNIEKSVINCMDAFKPHVICISIRNLDNQILIAPVFYLNKVKLLINMIRRKSSCKIITGGTGFSAEPESIFRFLSPDFGIQGEGNCGLNQLLSDFSDRCVPGLVWQDAQTGLIKTVHPSFNNNMGTRQDKALLNFINLKRYIREGSCIGIQTKKGCSRNCSYCDNFKMSGTNCKSFNAGSILRQIQNVIDNTGFCDFCFVDEIFSDNLPETKMFLKEMIRQRIKIKFEITDAPLNIDDEYVMLLKKAGCSGIMLGIDSGSDKMLQSYNKSFLKKDILKAVHYYNKYELPYYITCLFGGPGEDRLTINESIRFINRLPKVSAVLINYGIRILSKTEIARYTENRGLLNNTGLLKPVFYLSKGFTKREWQKIIDACRKYLGWGTFNKTDSLIIKRSLKALRNLLPSPRWKYAKVMSFFLKPVRILLSLFMREYRYSEIKGKEYILRD